ncbi:MAG: fibronectin type III domain-containing protein [Oscillospiraceae bacterium]|nr:fibronectin type III domain-containing protein [Oscillospiraceae bacterium]MDY2848560.1 fibronectin type III domain-containing protein [Oscillospiraceae bacterium]
MKNIKKKIAAVMAAFMLASASPVTVGDNSCDFAIECAAAESVLPAPGNVTAQVKDNTVTLSWDKVKGAYGYRVYKYDAAKKKFVTYKSLKVNKIVINNLEEGSTYRFKVATLVKNGKSYKAGTASKTVTVSIPKPETTTSVQNEKVKFKEVKLSAKEMAGAWEYYDFRNLTDISKSNTYDPSNKECVILNGWIKALQFVTEKTVVISYQEDYADITVFNASSKTIGESSYSTSYKIFTDGTDYYLFYKFVNGDGNNTYVFKKKALPKFERVKDVSLLQGYWTAVDFCNFELSDKITYDPTSPVESDYLYLTNAQVKDKKITFYYSDGYTTTHTIKTDNIDTRKYFVYSCGDDMYMYYQWISGDGDKQFYVLKKDK